MELFCKTVILHFLTYFTLEGEDSKSKQFGNNEKSKENGINKEKHHYASVLTVSRKQVCEMQLHLRDL